MFYGRKNIIALGLIFILSICFSVFCYSVDFGEVIAAEQSDVGVYTLKDMSTDVDGMVFTDADKYVYAGTNVSTNDNNKKIGRLQLINKAATFKCQIDSSAISGKFYVIVRPLDESLNPIKFCIDLSAKNMAIDNKKTEIASIISTNIANTFSLSCYISDVKSVFTIRNDIGELSLSNNSSNVKNAGSKFDLLICHDSAFADSSIHNSYYDITTMVANEYGEFIKRDELKIERKQKLDISYLKTPESYTVDNESYEFDYWQVDGKIYDFSQPVNSSFTLTAVYKKTSEVQGSITVVGSDGSRQTFKGSEVALIDEKLDRTKIENNREKIKGFSYNGKLYKKLSEIPREENDIEVTAETINVYMENGASVRLIEPAGIRFSGGMGTDCEEYGIFLTVKDYLADKESNMTVEYLEKNNIQYKLMSSKTDGIKQSVKDGISTFSMVLHNIKAENYGVEFVARSFVKVEYSDGTESYVYSDFSFENNSRSIYRVSVSAVKKTQDSKDVLQKYIDGTLELVTDTNGEITLISEVERNYEVKISKVDSVVSIEIIPTGESENINICSVLLDGKVRSINSSANNIIEISCD